MKNPKYADVSADVLAATDTRTTIKFNLIPKSTTLPNICSRGHKKLDHQIAL